MKFGVKKDKISVNAEQFLRSAGYKYITDHRSGKESFVKQPGRNRYPRFHIYLDHQPEVVFFDLHLDQKEASYPGAHAHNAEYDGAVVEEEINRLKNLILQHVRKPAQEPREREEDKEEKGFFGKLFGR